MWAIPRLNQPRHLAIRQIVGEISPWRRRPFQAPPKATNERAAHQGNQAQGEGTPNLTHSTSFTLVGLRADGVSLSVDFVPEAALATALSEARSFLAAHDSCAVVEVWTEGELVARLDEACVV